MYKALFLVLIIFSALPSFAQKKVKEVDTLTYDHMIDKRYVKEHYKRLDFSFKVYKATDGNCYKVGDTLVLGNAAGSGLLASDVNRLYANIFYGSPFIMLNASGRKAVEARYKGYQVTIHEMDFINNFGKIMNYVVFVTNPLPDRKFSYSKDVTVENVDQAITEGEILPLNGTAPMSSDEAIKLLKKKKEELDLGIISQAQYDSLRVKLAPIIMKSEN